MHSSISVMDKVNINEQNSSIAIGPLYLYTEFDAIYLKLWRFQISRDIGPHNVGTVLVQDTKVYSHTEQWCRMTC